MMVRQAEIYINDKLRITGWVSLNEVYETLGFPRELEAQIVGWKISNVNDYQHYVEFGIFPQEEFDIKIVFLNMVKLL